MNSQTTLFFYANPRFRYICEIGSGGAGDVVKAEDLSLNKIVAIKLLSTDYSEKGIARLQREAVSAGNLNHPNITKVFDFAVTSEGTPYMVMEYIEGDSLSTVIEKQTKLKIETALPIFTQLAQALAHAHKHGVIHRDLKPSNIMLSKTENGSLLVKLLDFGIAKKQNEEQFLTSAGTIVGSPIYMSPEQIDGVSVESSSDIYSLGCLMFEALSGNPPYLGSTVLETLSMHKSQSIEIPSLNIALENTQLNEKLAHLIQWCMQKDKRNRPSTIKLVEILNQISTGDFNENPLKVEPTVLKKNTSSSKWKFLSSLLLVLLLGSYFAWGSIKKPIQTLRAPSKKNGRNDTRLLTSARKFTELQSTPLILQANPDANVTDADLAQFRGKKIERLSLDLVKLTGSGLAFLRDSDLVRIDIHNVPLNSEGMKLLSQLKSLRHLDIISEDITADGFMHLKNLKNLQTLSLNCKNLSQENICALASLPQISNLEIIATSISGQTLAKLSAAKSLHRLALLDCQLNPPFARSIISPKLSEVDFNQSRGVTKELLLNFSNSKVTNLLLEDSKLSAQEMQAITSIGSLQYLNLSRAEFATDDIALFAELPNLKILKLNGISQTTDNLFDAIHKLKISKLFLDETKTTNKQLLTLLKMRTLREISLEDCPEVSERTCKEFQETFRALWKQPIRLFK